MPGVGYRCLLLAGLLVPAVISGQVTDIQEAGDWRVKTGLRLRTEWKAGVKEDSGRRLSAARVQEEGEGWLRVTAVLAPGVQDADIPGLELSARRGDIAAGLVRLQSLFAKPEGEAVDEITQLGPGGGFPSTGFEMARSRQVRPFPGPYIHHVIEGAFFE